MRVDLSTLQAAGFVCGLEQADANAINIKRLDAGASPTLTPQSSCGELESCDDDASATGRGRHLPAWLQSGASTAHASKGARGASTAHAKGNGRRPASSSQASATVPSWLAARKAPATDRLAALRARGETVRSTMAHEPPSSRRGQRMQHAANILPGTRQQGLFGLHPQASRYSEHEMNALQAYGALLKEEAIESMYEAATYAAFQQGFLYGCELQSDVVDPARPMKIHVDGLSTLAEGTARAGGALAPVTLAPPPGL